MAHPTATMCARGGTMVTCDPPPAGDRCANCATATTGAFCAACGQRTDTRRLAIRGLLTQFCSELTGYEAPLMKTLRGVLKDPGRVASDYVSGRRVTYTNPIKWAIVATALQFLVSHTFGNDKVEVNTGTADDMPTWLHRALDLAASNAAPLFVLLLMPVLAVALRLCFTGTGRTIAEELTLVLFASGGGQLLQCAYLLLASATGLPTGPGGLLPVAWVVRGAVAFHARRRPWAAVSLAVLAHILWGLLLAAAASAVVGIVWLCGLFDGR